ncbi:MAG: hypothetical protein HDT43_02750 [Ruminococcaceae bacterium]|nr:hypothetical protein [Oscillospiraceae bacterium]
MNKIIDELFGVYLDGKLGAKPHLSTNEEDEELEAVERQCAPTKEDLRVLENYIFKYGRAQEKFGFYAGFHTAFELFAEIYSLKGILE